MNIRKNEAHDSWIWCTLKMIEKYWVNIFCWICLWSIGYHSYSILTSVVMFQSVRLISFVLNVFVDLEIVFTYVRVTKCWNVLFFCVRSGFLHLFDQLSFILYYLSLCLFHYHSSTFFYWMKMECKLNILCLQCIFKDKMENCFQNSRKTWISINGFFEAYSKIHFEKQSTSERRCLCRIQYV